VSLCQMAMASTASECQSQIHGKAQAALSISGWRIAANRAMLPLWETSSGLPWMTLIVSAAAVAGSARSIAAQMASHGTADRLHQLSLPKSRFERTDC
jgi:hypothetical protein